MEAVRFALYARQIALYGDMLLFFCISHPEKGIPRLPPAGGVPAFCAYLKKCKKERNIF